MKTKFLLLSVAAAFFAACGSDDTADIIIYDNSVVNNNSGGGDTSADQTVNLSGVYTENLVLDANTDYLITGPVLMASGTTLTIPAGITIKAQPVGVNAYIAIQQGAQINAVGTSSQPVVFTSNAGTPGSGDWGGIVLCAHV